MNGGRAIARHQVSRRRRIFADPSGQLVSLMGRMLDSSISKRPEDLAAPDKHGGCLAPMIAMVLVAMTGFACYLPF